MRTPLLVVLPIAVVMSLVPCRVSLAVPIPPVQAERLVAETGFNDLAGIYSSAIANSPYQLDSTISGQGIGETGWLTSWTVVSGPIANSTVQSGIAFEGDGALHARRTTNTFRKWAEPLSEIVIVELYARLTANSQSVFYIYGHDQGDVLLNADLTAGPTWFLRPDGTVAIGPDGQSNLSWTPDVWHKFTAIADVPSQTFRFFLDDVEHITQTSLRFRGDPEFLNGFNYLAEVPGNGAYLDSLRVTAVPEPGTLALGTIGLLGILGYRQWIKRESLNIAGNLSL